MPPSTPSFDLSFGTFRHRPRKRCRSPPPPPGKKNSPATPGSCPSVTGLSSWLPDLIGSMGIDPKLLASRTDASPIEFHSAEPSHLARFVQALLENLTSSDFMLAFPSHPILCTIPHHKQLWWTSSKQPLIERISGYSPV